MDRIPEFVSNHPILFGALVATIVMIVVAEYQRARRAAQPVTPARATRLSNSENAAFIDARRRKDFEAGHLPGARNVPASEVEQHIKQLEKLRELPVILYDDGGLDAERAAKTLAKHGFSRLFALDGGLPAWRKADLPVETQQSGQGKKKKKAG